MSTLTSTQVEQIFAARLGPHLPAHLTGVEPQSTFVRYTFRPFNGREAEPRVPQRFWHDPQLAYQHLDEDAGRPLADPAEYELRDAARCLLDDVYRAARTEWRNARYLAALKEVLADGTAAAGWQRWEQAKKTNLTAYAYLREPEASTQWPAASRLVDSHTELRAAAAAFDEKAEQIAQIHWDHMDEYGYGREEALRRAGHPEATGWEICDHDDYRLDYSGEWGPYDRCLQAQAQRLITEQKAHIAEVVHLLGAAAARTQAEHAAK